MRVLFAIACVAALAACSRPAPEGADAPPSDAPPEIAACNSLIPDGARQVTIQDEAAAALPAADMLRGGPVTPGLYDLVSAVRIGAATGWRGARAVVLDIAETDAGLVLNWAGTDGEGAADTWTATLTDAPQARLTYTCGRIGEVEAAYLAAPDALNLQIADGAGGALHMVFAQRR